MYKNAEVNHSDSPTFELNESGWSFKFSVDQSLAHANAKERERERKKEKINEWVRK